MNEPPKRSDDDLQAMRRIIVGPAIEQIEKFEARMADPELRAQELSESLPRAISLATRADDQFARAITPAIETALERSAKHDPSVLAGAIFPLLGPAIRKAIAETFSHLLQGLNQTLTHSFSLQGLKWRLEALRTGKSFGEVVLSHTLVFRVEQVFLIHKQTSLLLQHVRAPSITGQDGDMVSGMLSAIQDFVRQSFESAKGDELSTLQVGELNVWIETGPQATLAVVIRGQAPMDLRAVMQDALELVHEHFGAALEKFEGDTTQFEATQPLLENCLRAQLSEKPAERSYRAWLFLALVGLLLLAWWVPHWRENRRWNTYIERLRNQEGILVAESSKHWGTFYVTGLRDPLAADPRMLLRESGVRANRVVSRWEPCESTMPEFILRRARKRLGPPPGVSFQFQNGVLYATGVAPESWTEAIRRIAAALPGVTEFDSAGLIAEAPSTFAMVRSQIDNVSIFFEEDGITPNLGQDDVLKALRDRIRQVVSVAGPQGLRVRVNVVGHANSRGSEDYNLRLSKERANNVGHWLTEHGIDAQTLSLEGVGTHQPLREEKAEEDRAQNRRVSFRVLLEPATR